jgi:uncharacterized protein (DUF885 family)
MLARCLALFALLAGVTSAALAAPVSSPDLSRLCDEFWQDHLFEDPVSATQMGDHRYDDRLDDNTLAGIARQETALKKFLARARAIDEPKLTSADKLTRLALIGELENELAQIDCDFEEWVVDPLNGPQVDFNSYADFTVLRSPADGVNYVKRCRAMGPYLDQHVANLRRGLAAGKAATRSQVERVLAELDTLLARPVRSWGMLTPMDADRRSWPQAARDQFDRDLTDAAKNVVEPAYQRYRAFLATSVKPAARSDEKVGIGALPGGVSCYRKLIKVHTSLDRTPEELHKIGLDQVDQYRLRLAELGQRVFGTSDVAEIQKRLRTDPAMHFANAGEIEAKARTTLARAKAAIPGWFGRLPKEDCQVKVMGMHEAPNSTIAYYREGAPDGSRPGYYMINTYQPTTRPRYEAEALAFHESIPGHHLQIAIAQELKDVPDFRRFLGVTAFVEGWALYTERLADEMGLYSSDVDRMGMLSYDAWRSCRLVVDTGMHAMGWSRQQAIDYMVQNTCLAQNNIENEVDRYITWPGQALAYKMGQLEILSLRDEAKQRLGNRFDIRAFHDAVLSNGAVSLPMLHRQVEDWIVAQENAPAARSH